ncbi:hypothetical protein E2C01_039888 [Portunus trituberculatus]|uniref:Uncharacterized protein n=1 Tax=Portunus trituberculatus TaxID=210409 RepID=A0A5B7FLV6_PORTR|nr:hypothetical protein [Portunus trituberculatus]
MLERCQMVTACVRSVGVLERGLRLGAATLWHATMREGFLRQWSLLGEFGHADDQPRCCSYSGGGTRANLVTLACIAVDGGGGGGGGGDDDDGGIGGASGRGMMAAIVMTGFDGENTHSSSVNSLAARKPE